MPQVSVILPVYNAEKFLREAIDSILNQTFTDFELLIINDGSTDGSEVIIRSYKDKRIIYLKNEENKGLIFCLNRAIDLAGGEFIARMDADDISLPERLEKQVNYLKQNEVAVLATRVQLIDEEGNSLPTWVADAKNITAAEIKKYLLKDNCLAHPTVMAKAALFKKYRYKDNQKYSEDYDLWLRLLADGFEIAKMAEPLLLHRILPTSVTRFKKVNIYYRLAKVKFRFLWQQLRQGRLTAFNSKVLLHGSFDFFKAAGKEVKGLFTK